MATQKWNVTVNGVIHEVSFKEGVFKNTLSVDGNPLKFKKLLITREKSVTKIAVPVGEDVAYLYRLFNNKKLVYKGIDVETGEAYVPMKYSPLMWVFTVLYAICFFVLVGGALGAALDIVGISFTARIANDSSKSNISRILICTGMFILLIVIELVAKALLQSLLSF